MSSRGFRVETRLGRRRRLTPALPALRWLLGLGLFLGFQAVECQALPIPKLAPVNFCEADQENRFCQSSVEVFVNRLDSEKFPYSYKYDSFDFCQDSEKTRPENLEQALFGEQMTSSPYKFSFNKTETCIKVCIKSYDPANEVEKYNLGFLKKRIILNYQHHWIIDSMPVLWCYDIGDDGKKNCKTGFPVGCLITHSGESKDCIISSELNKNDTLCLFNHVDITITYHRESDGNCSVARLVGVRVDPKSYKHADENHLTCKGPPIEIPASYTNKLSVTYSYSVKFEENKNVDWASRWDYILDSMSHTDIQWSSVMNCFVVILFLSGLVAMIMLKAFHRDIIRYNQMKSLESAQEEFGWKLLHGNIFRVPEDGMLLSVFLGQGTKILMMTFSTLFLACIGYLSPADPVSLMTCAIRLWILLGAPAGYVSAKMYRTFKGMKWKTHFLLTALLCPGIILADFLIMNLILWVKGSSAVLSFPALINLLGMWFGISIPLTLFGEYYGCKEKFQCPVHTNNIPYHTPQQNCFRKLCVSILIGSILPFGCIIIQLFSILNSIWSHQIYHMFGLLFLVFIVLLIICSEAAILLCYFQISCEDYHWWWRSFFTSSFTTVYLFIYALHYFFTKFQLTSIASTILFFGYTMIIVLIFFLATGTAGFFACFWFVTTMYNAVKAD